MIHLLLLSLSVSYSSVSARDPHWQSDSFSIYPATDNKWPQNLGDFLGILHHNETCPLSMNLPPTTSDFALLPLEAGHTGSYYWHAQ